jgi:hypothetical protein
MVTTQQNMNPIESMVGKSEKIHVNILMIWWFTGELRMVQMFHSDGDSFRQDDLVDIG